jgi:PAP2 superfamily
LTRRSSFRASSIAGDHRWLFLISVVTIIEFGCWAVSWCAGHAPVPWLFTYLLLAFACLGSSLAARSLLCAGSAQASWPSLFTGTALIAIGASLFLPLKFAIPKERSFWLDTPLAAAERSLFGTDPWRILDHYLGWATVPLDRLYGLWLPVQLLCLFAVLLRPPSRAKSRALIAYSLGWFLLGVVAAALFASAGPIFYDRLMGGHQFAALGETLRSRGATLAIVESDTMWRALASNKPGLVAGISAFPSIHVAISLWIFLSARTLARPLAKLAIAYFLLVAIASVQLGWHYVSDGVGGAIGMLGLWGAAKIIDESQLFDSASFGRSETGMFMGLKRRYLDLVGSIYLYNEHRGYTAIDRVLEAVQTRWPDDRNLITQIAKHRADERKHYLMFRRWFERRGIMPFAVDSTCGHIDRFVGIMFRSTIDDLDPQFIVSRDNLFERMCRVISLTEKRGHKQVEILLRHPIVRSDNRLIKIFRIIEEDEPSHWAPYDEWLENHGKRTSSWWERRIDGFIHSELLFLKLPLLFLNPKLARRDDWADDNETTSAAEV